MQSAGQTSMHCGVSWAPIQSGSAWLQTAQAKVKPWRRLQAATRGYEEFLRRKLYKLPGLRHSRSTFVLRCLKRTYSVAP